MKTIVITYDPGGRKGGKQGCYRSVIKENPGTRGAGTCPYSAAFDLLITAVSHDLSGDIRDYNFDYSACPTMEEKAKIDEDQTAMVSLMSGLFLR